MSFSWGIDGSGGGGVAVHCTFRCLTFLGKNNKPYQQTEISKEGEDNLKLE